MRWLLLAAILWTSPAMATDAASQGQAIFARNCAPCHGPGIGNPGASQKPGTAALAAKYGGILPALLEERRDLTPELVAFFVRNGATVMAPYRKTEISDAELAALGTYLSRNNPKPSGRKIRKTS